MTKQSSEQSLDNILLVRIDERQKEMCKDLDEIKQSLKTKVSDGKDYQDMSKKVDTLWDDRNKVLGMVIAAGMLGGTFPLLLQGLVKAILANF